MWRYLLSVLALLEKPRNKLKCLQFKHTRMTMTSISLLSVILLAARADDAFHRSVVSTEQAVVLNKHCRERERLITSDENDEYLLVSAEIGTIIILECRFCNDKEEIQPKIWYYQDRYKDDPETEVELGMDNNASYNRIYTSPQISLVIKDFMVKDAGIYRCHGEKGQEIEKKFNYRLEPIIKEHGVVFTEEGNITEWERYREIYLAPISIRFAVSQMSDLMAIRERGIILDVVLEWAPWGACENCIRGRGHRSSVGRCRLKRGINTTIAGEDEFEALELFRKSPLLPCKSMLLQEEFPSVSNAIRHLPEYVLKEPCKKCAKVKKKKGRRFMYIKRYVLAEGAHLTVTCPESSIDTHVVWKKDSITLEKGVGRSFRKMDPSARVIVDTFSTLYLTGLDVSVHEQGNYTCYVDNINMMQLKVVVVSRGKLLTQELLRHLEYLAFIFLLCSFCYCTGLLVVCKRRDRFTTADAKKATGTEEEKKPFIQ